MRFRTSTKKLAPLRRSKRFSANDVMGASSEETTPVPVLKHAHSQDQAPFFQILPAEIRRMIYTFALDAQKIHIKTSYGGSRWPKLAAVPCHAVPSEPPCRDHISCHDEHCAGRIRFIFMFTLGCTCEPWNVLGLSLTCRLLYVETIPILYGSHVFLFTSRGEFLRFCECLLFNRPFTVSPLLHLKHIVLNFPWPYKSDKAKLNEMHAAITLLADRAVSLKRLEVNISRRGTYLKLRPGHKLLSRDSLWVLGRFRGLETLNLAFEPCSWGSIHPGALKGRPVLEQCLRNMVCQSQGSMQLTKAQFDKHFGKMYQALMAQSEDGS